MTHVRRLGLILLVSGCLTAAWQASGQETPAREAGAAFDVEAATEEYLARLSPEQRERSDNYFEGGYWLRLWSFLYGLGVAWLLLGTRLSARMRDLGERFGRWRPLAILLYGAQYLLLTTVLAFPLTLYTGYFREHAYGLSNQTFGEWLRDQLVGLGVGAVLGGVFLLVLYAVFRRAERTWWQWGSAVALLFLVLGLLIAPVYIAPLFNTYDLLEDPAVLDPILEMARANGVDADRVYQFDASRQSSRISANVSGFAGTMRISLNDNLLERCGVGEVKAVMGHELGHYVLNHIYESLVFFGAVFFLGFAFLRWSFAACLARWGERWRVRGIADVAGLPLLSALFSVYFFALTPVLNTYIRVNEAEADLFGLNAARQPEGFAEVAMKLSEYRKIAPGPIEEWIFFDHPSGRSRVRMAMEWKAEHLFELEAMRDPKAVDEEFPAALVESLEISSQGRRLNGILYLAAGRGPHPTAVLLHGLPGNERNLDLAHALRRAGWNVAFVHYRGAWGSEGEFSFAGNVEDAGAIVGWLRGEDARERYRVDPDRIVLVGHSMGGGTALVAAATVPEVRAAVSIAGADLGVVAGLEGESRDRMAARLESLLPLTVPSGRALLDETAAAAADLRLPSHAEALAKKPLLFVTGSRDQVVDAGVHQAPLVEALREAGAADVTEVVIDGADHAFSDRRVALTETVVTWLVERFE
jgi:STE24 endopeptidase